MEIELSKTVIASHHGGVYVGVDLGSTSLATIPYTGGSLREVEHAFVFPAKLVDVQNYAGEHGSRIMRTNYTALGRIAVGGPFLSVETCKESFNIIGRQMLDDSLRIVKHELSRDWKLLEYLVPEKFTMTQARKAYDALCGTRRRPTTFARDLRKRAPIEPTNEYMHAKSGRPAQLFKFVE